MSSALFSPRSIRNQFPILSRKIGKKPLVYIDNEATTQKPLSVLNAMDNYYCTHNANVHRGIHKLA
ncbi:MAG: aminotransferase class V-fold PLP-dependent enzyme [archaeon]